MVQAAIAAHGKRIVSAVILGLLALGVAILGGPLFLIFWTIAAFGIFWEWNGLVKRRRATRRSHSAAPGSRERRSRSASARPL